MTLWWERWVPAPLLQRKRFYRPPRLPIRYSPILVRGCSEQVSFEWLFYLLMVYYWPVVPIKMQPTASLARSEGFEPSQTQVRSLPHYPDYANRVYGESCFSSQPLPKPRLSLRSCLFRKTTTLTSSKSVSHLRRAEGRRFPQFSNFHYRSTYLAAHQLFCTSPPWHQREDTGLTLAS